MASMTAPYLHDSYLKGLAALMYCTPQFILTAQHSQKQTHRKTAHLSQKKGERLDGNENVKVDANVFSRRVFKAQLGAAVKGVDNL